MAQLDLTNKNSVQAVRKNTPAAPIKPLSQIIREKMATTLSGKKLDTFIADVIALTSTNPDIAKCNQISIIAACMQAQTLGLSLNQQLGQAYIVPFGNSKQGDTKATFILGYRGYIQLAIRTGEYTRINVTEIKEGELKHWDALNEEIEVELIEDFEEREKTPTAGYYAMFQYKNGFRKALYWTKTKMDAHARKYSQPYMSDVKYGNAKSMWSKDFDAMAKKTMLRQLISKWGAMTTDMITAISTDGAVAVDVGKFEYQDAFDVEAVPVKEPKVIEQKKSSRSKKEAVESVDAETGEVNVAGQDAMGDPTPEEIAEIREMERRQAEEQRDRDFYGD